MRSLFLCLFFSHGCLVAMAGLPHNLRSCQGHLRQEGQGQPRTTQSRMTRDSAKIPECRALLCSSPWGGLHLKSHVKSLLAPSSSIRAFPVCCHQPIWPKGAKLSPNHTPTSCMETDKLSGNTGLCPTVHHGAREEKHEALCMHRRRPWEPRFQLRALTPTQSAGRDVLRRLQGLCRA